ELDPVLQLDGGATISPGLRAVIGRAYFEAGKHKEAISHLNAAAQALPGDQQVAIYRALVVAQTSQAADALTTLNQLAAGVAKSMPLAHYAVGAVAFGRKDFATAEKELMRAQEGHAEVCRVHYYLGKIALGQNRINEGIDRLKKSVDANSQFRPAQ